MQRLNVAETGVLFDENANSIWTGVANPKARAWAPPWPRSFAGDGYASTLVIHLVVQLATLAVLVVAAVKVRDRTLLNVVDVIASLAIAGWASGLFSLLVVAVVARFPTDNVFATASTVAGYTIGFAMTVCLVAFSVRSDDDFTGALGWGLAAICCQAVSLGLYAGCVINLAARGGRAYTQPGIKGNSLQLNKEYRAEVLDFPS